MELVHEQIKGRVLPPARRDHACVVVRDNMYVIGGWNTMDFFNDVWFLNPCQSLCAPGWVILYLNAIASLGMAVR